MNCRLFALLFVVFFWGAATNVLARAGGGSSFTFTFDENGNGTVDGQGDPGVLFPDPTQSGHPLVLGYGLPGAGMLENGDVRIYNDFIGGHLSDVLRFTDSQGRLFGQTADVMIFYSESGGGAFADTGFPPGFVVNDGGGILETLNPDGSKGFRWTAAGPAVYIGISEIPEPATMTLFELSAAVWVARSRNRRN